MASPRDDAMTADRALAAEARCRTICAGARPETASADRGRTRDAASVASVPPRVTGAKSQRGGRGIGARTDRRERNQSPVADEAHGESRTTVDPPTLRGLEYCAGGRHAL